jgi:effector-binding domain-containing protein
MSYEIDIVTVPSRTLAVTRFRVSMDDLPDMGQKMGSAFGQVMTALSRAGVTSVGPAMACYEPTEGGFDVAAGFPTSSPMDPTDGVTTLELAAGEVAHTTHVGPYTDLPKAYVALRDEVEAQGRHLDDRAPMWEEYLTGPDVPPDQALTEVFWPLAA